MMVKLNYSPSFFSEQNLPTNIMKAFVDRVPVLHDSLIKERERILMKKIPTPKISEILKQEFMLPFDLSTHSLAKSLGISTSCIEDILHDRRQITADTSIRLGRFFGVSDRYFLNIQNDIEFRNAEENHRNEYNAIRKYQIRDQRVDD